MKNKMHCIHYIERMDNHQILLLAAGCVLLYFLWLTCSAERFEDEPFEDEPFEDEGFRARRFARKAAGRVKRGVKKGVKKVIGKNKGHHKRRGDMTGLTFVCKAVDFGPMGGAGRPHTTIGPMAKGAGVAGVARGKGGRGKTRRGPRNTPTRGMRAEMNLRTKRKQRFKLPRNA
jgi:hypothetical protein